MHTHTSSQIPSKHVQKTKQNKTKQNKTKTKTNKQNTLSSRTLACVKHIRALRVSSRAFIYVFFTGFLHFVTAILDFNCGFSLELVS